MPEDLYKRVESAVIVGNDITEWLRQTFGVRQGIMSPDLFNLYLEHIMRVALRRVLNEDGKAYIGGRRVDNLRFADDIAPFTKTLERAQDLLQKVDQESTRYGQETSQAKTE